MTTSLIQVKVDLKFKRDIEWMADYKGISISSYIKLTLTETLREEKKKIYTINGLTEDQETEILKMEEELIEEYKKGLVKPLKAKDFLKELND